MGVYLMSAHERFLADIRQYPDFRKDPALALELVRKMQGGDKESEAHLIASALKLIAEVTKRHCARWNAWQSEEDLRQEASQNVAAKISKFNPKKATLEAYIRFCSRMAFIRFWYDQQAIHLSDSKALGDVDASLLLAYEGRGTAYFQDLYITFKHKCMKESAARKWAQRQRDKVAKYIERRGRRTD